MDGQLYCGDFGNANARIDCKGTEEGKMMSLLRSLQDKLGFAGCYKDAAPTELTAARRFAREYKGVRIMIAGRGHEGNLDVGESNLRQFSIEPGYRIGEAPHQGPENAGCDQFAFHGCFEVVDASPHPVRHFKENRVIWPTVDRQVDHHRPIFTEDTMYLFKVEATHA
jgi:hypothetical protein